MTKAIPACRECIFFKRGYIREHRCAHPESTYYYYDKNVITGRVKTHVNHYRCRSERSLSGHCKERGLNFQKR